MNRLLKKIGRAVALNGFWVPLQFQDTALPAITIPAAVAVLQPQRHVQALAQVLALMSLLAMIVPPVAGALSDYLRRRGVPRRALIWGGGAVDMVSLILLANMHSFGGFVLFVLLATFGANICLAAYQAMIPDVVPKEQWGAVSGIRNVATLIGVILGFAVAAGTTTPTTFIGVAVAIGVGAVVLLAQPERRLVNQDEEEHAHVSDWHDFTVVFIARFFLAFGLALLMTFVLYFFRDILHVGNPSAGTAFVGFASLAGAIVSGIYLGWLSDRVPRKTIVALCGIPMTLAAAGFATFPEEHWMYAFGVLFGIGFGGIMSTGWALAIDSVPKLRDVARDLGIWGIAQNAPQVVAPLAGSAVLGAFNNSETGYRVLFFSAAVFFALGSAVVLGVGTRPILPWWGTIAQLLSGITVWCLQHAQTRVRSWGKLPYRRPPSIIIANHQIEMDLMEPFACFILGSAIWNPTVSASAKLMYEPGFMARRIPWMRRFARNANFGWLFAGLGLFQLENELQTRSLARWSFAVERRHGRTLLSQIFKPAFVEAHNLQRVSTADLFSPQWSDKAQMIQAKWTDLQTAYRKELFEEMRAGVELDLARFEDVLKRGATLFLTPEGEYPSDGKMLPFRGIWDRLAPLATQIYLCAISYDPLRTGKFRQLYRVVPANGTQRAREELAAARPVTASAVLAQWLCSRDPQESAFSAADAVAAVRSSLAALPKDLFVEPELRRDPQACVHDALRAMVQLRILEAGADGSYRLGEKRTHPEFPHTADILEQQRNFLDETVAAAKS